MDNYKYGFEEDDLQRSSFIRLITLQQINEIENISSELSLENSVIPKILLRYWHDSKELPEDVQNCIDSWDRLREEKFELRMFNDETAANYIAEKFGSREIKAFDRCRHPAMRSDYFRMCFIFNEGGFYVDTDEVLRGEGWKKIFRDNKLKLQPLCYDIPSGKMVPAAEIWQKDLYTGDRIFYVNNNPIAAPANHPILRHALTRATERLLREDKLPEIQSTTGPGNLTAVLAAHAHKLKISGSTFDFEFIKDWESIAETRWDLSYRGDARNWRNMHLYEKK